MPELNRQAIAQALSVVWLQLSSETGATERVLTTTTLDGVFTE
jgi:hypothetical protein